ncbi:Replication factor C subunit 1 [Fasciolopsis buskii]|uniref:Activator 1 large subunit n=1 Tax=Fasciolopsis buskii TaxID=27845 RepID=A0A8E0RVS3_9TREM|nr:Replication factor C subunit 1 [Fasciolopsis buski]
MLSTVTLLSLNFAGAKSRAYSSAPPWATGTNDDGAWARAALLSGLPGIGKTSSAMVVCRDLGFTTCELNASDCRSKRSLQEEISQTLGMQNLKQMACGEASELSRNHHVLIMDEVDGMAGNEDRGGMQELINMIKTSRIPVICICNDRQSPKVRSLANYCLDLRFQRPRIEQIKAAILSIACKEHVNIPPAVLTEIIQASNQDIRQVINNTQMWCVAKLADESQLTADASGARKNVRLSAFEVIRKVFSPDVSGQNGHQATLNECLDLFFQDYSLVPLFVQENYLNVKPKSVQGNSNRTLRLLSEASKHIALGDIISKAIRSAGTGSWSLLPTVGILSTVIPGHILSGSLPGGVGPGSGVSFPSWFGKNSNYNRMRRVSCELSSHLNLATHGGSSNPRNLVMEYASVLADSLTRPLKEGDTDRVLQTLLHYNLQREDLDALLELATWSDRPSRMHGIDGKAKAALTRAFNKSTHLLPYATVTMGKLRSKKANPGDGDIAAVDPDVEDANGLFDTASPDSSDDDLQEDAMISRKTAKTHVSATSGSSKSTSQSSSTSVSTKRSHPSTRGRGTSKTTSRKKSEQL